MNLTEELLSWIGEEHFNRVSAGQETAIPVHVLLLRMSLRAREDEGEDLSESVELSLRTFDRASVYRTLKQLEDRDLIRPVTPTAKPAHTGALSSKLAPKPTENKGPEYVAITEHGLLELQRMELLAKAEAEGERTDE